MPKVTGTKIEKLKEAFEKKQTLTAQAIERMFPESVPAEMIWQLEMRRGLVFEKKRAGRKIVAYTLNPEKRAPIVMGSKRLWLEQQERKAGRKS